MSLREQYLKTVAPALAKEFGVDNPMAVPTLKKVTLSVGISAKQKDPKFLETAETVLTRVSGQRPVKTKAKVAISNFKTRKGQVVGLKVTIRGKRMWDFTERLVATAFPRIRDFRGLSGRSFDGRGNYSLGIKEQIIFPEIDFDKVDALRGMDITIVTTAKSNDEARALLVGFNFPIRS